MLKLAKYLKPYFLQCILLAFATATQTWFTLLLPSEMAKIVNNGIVENNIAFIYESGLRMLVFVLVSSLCAIASGYLSAYIGSRFSRDLRADIYAKVLNFSIADNDKFSTASLITRTTNDVNQVQQTYSMILSMFLRAPMMAIVALIQAFATAQDMTWIIALAVAIILISAISIISFAIPKFKIFQKLFDKITLITRENLTGIRVIRAFNNQKIERKKFSQTNIELTGILTWMSKVTGLVTPIITFVFDGICLLCIWIGLKNYEFDANYLGNMMAFMQYAIQVVMSFMILTLFFVSIPRANVSAGRIKEVLNTHSKIIWPKKTKTEPSKTPSVIFKDVDFRYGEAEDNVLNDVSFEAKVGETTAIIGSTGSGKSTIANLILRFYDATNGKVLINGVNVKDFSKKDLMKKIGYVPQRGILFSGTIESNIKFSNPNITDEKMEKASKISQSKEFVEKNPEKYNLKISQRGTNVSGGQKQRLSIARAIAKNPEIYIFDDSFSALDMKTDKKLREELKEIVKESVTIIIAQRINTIKDADQIIVLDKGRIVGKGNHHSLLRTCKIYNEIVKSQLSEAEFEKELLNAREEK
ncbi:ABC transporter ATP-binding protein [Candidatus Saccharibacteria bacterium]|nr:ABC transporter ATP-binding protein [Candidatus Saccharibacteria bacterium]